MPGTFRARDESEPAMKVRHRYGKLEARTFEFTRSDVERIVREYITAKHLSVAIPIGAQGTANAPCYWVEDWEDDDGDRGHLILSVRQEFIYDMRDEPPAVEAVMREGE